MKKRGALIASVSVILLLVSLRPMIDMVKAPEGPRSHLDIVWYTNSDTASTAMVNDEVDMVQWSLTDEQRVAVEDDENLQIASYVENGMMEHDFQNNYTIADYPLARNQ